MTSDRPYKRSMTVEAALSELRRCKDTQFDGTIVEAFCSVIEQEEEAPPPVATQTGQAIAENFAEVLSMSE
jgi:HD-GYP domain-containing protein (c-di-GMP phosphodiesterase class II)